jgi:uncharacterized membrane protein
MPANKLPLSRRLNSDRALTTLDRQWDYLSESGQRVCYSPVPMLPERRHDISRLEAFSDAAFAFALTLLVVSLEVPRSYADLIRTMRGLPSFACCFALLVWIWHEHNLFFRRYGMQDGLTVFLNAVLVFVVLFYVYPLKFMFDSMFGRLGATPELHQMTLTQLSRASAIYGLGFLVLFLIFALLYSHAHRKRVELKLTPVEVIDVKAFRNHHLLSAGVGLLSIVFALGAPVTLAPIAPTIYSLMGPLHWGYGVHNERKRRNVVAAQR